MNGDDRNDYNQYYGNFPYKSYDEIVAEKRRRARYKSGCLVLFLLILAIILLAVAVSIWTGKSLFVKKDENPKNKPGQTITENNEPKHSGDFNLSVADTPSSEDADEIVIKDVSGVVKKTRNSVVGIITESFQNFSASSGSGIIVSSDGYIVTNNHVIENSDSITVDLDNGDAYQAYVIGTDEYTDLAVLKIDVDNLPAAEFGDSDLVEVGQAAIAIGNPTGQLMGTVTAGIISGVNRNVTVGNAVMSLIQTDASINPGNSGGPLINQYGQVIGVNSVKIKLTGYEGLGFAIPSNTVRPIVEELVQQGYVGGRPMVGISGRIISQMAGAFYSLPQGLLVDGVEPSSHAAKQGIATGDVITAIGDTRIDSLSAATSVRDASEVGDTVVLQVYRKGHVYEVKVTLMEQGKMGGAYNF